MERKFEQPVPSTFKEIYERLFSWRGQKRAARQDGS
jgi:hypothetical protein